MDELAVIALASAVALTPATLTAAPSAGSVGAGVAAVSAPAPVAVIREMSHWT